jgi:hypothetical protein
MSPQMRLELYMFLIEVRSNYRYIWSKLLSKWVSQQSYCLLVEHQFAVLWHSLHAYLCTRSLVCIINLLVFLRKESELSSCYHMSEWWNMEWESNVRGSLSRMLKQGTLVTYCSVVHQLLSVTVWIYSEGLIKKQLEHEVNWNKLCLII